MLCLWSVLGSCVCWKIVCVISLKFCVCVLINVGNCCCVIGLVVCLMLVCCFLSC